uniref:ATP synthase F0 subunit 6 n=1 Tax=Schistosoma turkestanicum TaxID=1163369 RepID=H9CWE4_9TREM|nr:ATP synthase F0 subunit 6 [Schistosoma turkestanicum]
MNLWGNSFLSRLFVVLSIVRSDFWYSLCLGLLFIYMFITRCPYIYGVSWYGCGVFFAIMPIFLSLFFSRLYNSVDEFLASLIPAGSPIWISPFVQIVELISYLIRPIVLFLRPLINISIGIVGSLYIGGLYSVLGWLVLGILFFMFFYEVFIVLIHWFIVQEILKFSFDH